jgi:anti-sigma factor RsiW
MRCEEVRNRLVEVWPQEAPEPVRGHLATCAKCRLYARDWERVRAGFAALAAEPAPEPSWGFKERVLRRLEEAPDTVGFAEEFFERAGRRVVYAAGVLALMLLLVMAVPSSGPLRGPTAAELYAAEVEAAGGTNSLYAAEVFDVPAAIPENGDIEPKP